MNTTNFDFIKSHWSELFKMASQSEHYAYSDPQSSIIKLRCFSELVVAYLYQSFKLQLDPKSDFYSRLNNQKFKDIINEKILTKFHAIRLKGNLAVHHNKAKSEDAIWLIEEAYLIACWFYKGHSNANQDICKEFVAPIDYGNKEDELNNTKIELEKTHSVVEELQKQTNDLKIDNQFDIEEFKSTDNQIINSIDMKEGEVAKRISIEDIFLDYKLTLGQTKLVEELKTFLSDKNQNIFLLKGYAGTGKTFITKGLTEYFTSIGKSYILAAPTGKAAKVIKEKTNNEAFTIHKTIYSYKDIKEYKVDNIDGSETFKFYFNLANNDNSTQTIYIIDEASMISDIEQEGEFFRFGSGKLLTDLLEYINLDHNDHNKKIIFIGDNAQLPPIGMNFSPALDEEYLKKEFNTTAVSFELTEVKRQKNDSGILENSIKIRESIQKNIFNKLDFNLKYTDVKHTEHEDLLNLYLESCSDKINGESMIIAHSNTVVDEYNSQIRKHFFPNQDFICPGDKVMSIANNNAFGAFVYNGDFGLVRKIDPEVERREVLLNYKFSDDEKPTTINVPLQFRKVKIGFNNIKNKAYFFECYILENILYPNIIYKNTTFSSYKQKDIKSIETKALYVDFTNRAKERGLKPNTEEFKQAIKSDQFFNCLKIKFGYAITCHKAQGSEWNNVFVNCKTHEKVLSKAYFRWLYTAITRASNKLYILDEPHITMLDALTESNIHMEHIKDTFKNNNEIAKNNDSSENSFNIEDEFLLLIYRTIKSVAEDHNIKILDLRHDLFQELYIFESNNEHSRVAIIYNSQNIVTSINAIETNSLSNLLKTLLDPLKNHLLGSAVHNEIIFDEIFLEDFYLSRKEKLEVNKIKITNIEHMQYRERYTFSRTNEIAIIDFTYNQQGQFTSNSLNSRSNSRQLIKDILESLS